MQHCEMSTILLAEVNFIPDIVQTLGEGKQLPIVPLKQLKLDPAFRFELFSILIHFEAGRLLYYKE